MATTTAASRIANQDINDYSRNQFGSPFSELTAQQKSGRERWRVLKHKRVWKRAVYFSRALVTHGPSLL